MNVRHLIVVVALAAVAACSDDTGILVEVHGEELTLQPARIDTMVIIDDGSGAPDSLAWGNSELQQATVTVDVRQTPHTVMLRPDGVALTTSVWVAAVAYDGAGNLMAWGQLDGAIAFEPDLVKKVAITLHPAARTDAGCVVKDGSVVSRTTPDCDGDQVDYQVDCDDLDALIGGDLDGDPVVCGADCDMTEPARYPGNREVCDGLDNDCDPATAPPPRLCAVVATDVEGNVVQCSVGERTCDDTVADAAYGACDHQMTLPAADYELCASWVGCADSPDPTCVADRGLRCKLPLAAAGEACTPSIAKLADLVPDANAVCNWRLIGNIQQGSWDVGLRPRGTTGPLVSLVPTCDAELVVDQAPGGPAPRIFILTYEDGNGEVQILSVLIDPVRKDCDPAAPSTLECEEVAP